MKQAVARPPLQVQLVFANRQWCESHLSAISALISALQTGILDAQFGPRGGRH